MGKNLDLAVKVDWCSQFVENVGVATYAAPQLMETFDLVFKRIQKTVLKLSIKQC